MVISILFFQKGPNLLLCCHHWPVSASAVSLYCWVKDHCLPSPHFWRVLHPRVQDRPGGPHPTPGPCPSPDPNHCPGGEHPQHPHHVPWPAPSQECHHWADPNDWVPRTGWPFHCWGCQELCFQVRSKDTVFSIREYSKPGQVSNSNLSRCLFKIKDQW